MTIDKTITQALQELKEKLEPFIETAEEPSDPPNLSHLEEALLSYIHPDSLNPGAILRPASIKGAYSIRKNLSTSLDKKKYNDYKQKFAQRRNHDLTIIKSYVRDVRGLLPTDKSTAPLHLVESHLRLVQTAKEAATNWYAPDIAKNLSSIESYFMLYIDSEKKKAEKIKEIKAKAAPQPIGSKENASKKKRSIAGFFVLPAAFFTIVGSAHESNAPRYPDARLGYETTIQHANDHRTIKEYRMLPKRLSYHELTTFVCEEGMYDKRRNRQADFPNNYISRPGGIIIDSATHLMWSSIPNPKFVNLQDARKQVKQLNRSSYKGYNDWKIPTMEQLLTINERDGGLVSYSGIELYLDPVFPRNIPWAVWSSDPSIEKNLQWRLDLRSGNAGTAYQYEAHAGVLLVRRAR